MVTIRSIANFRVAARMLIAVILASISVVIASGPARAENASNMTTTLASWWSGRCLDADAGSIGSNGTTVQLWDCSGAANQAWTVMSTGTPGLYTIHNAASGRCLDAENDSANNPSNNGDRVLLWDCHGGSNQGWYRYGNGALRNAMSGLCLDADTNTIASNGTKVQLWGCSGGANQSWTARVANTLTNAMSSRCLDADTNTINSDGTKAQLWDCTDQANQTWYITSDGTVINGHEEVQIVNATSGRCLDADTGAINSDGTNVTLWGCVPGKQNQSWYFVTDGTLRNAQSGRCLDADTGTIGSNGTRISLWGCSGAANQHWYLGSGKSAPFVALGDSYSSGLGTGNYSGFPKDGCYRSGDTYSEQLTSLPPDTTPSLQDNVTGISWLGPVRPVLLACASATTDALYAPFNNNPAQLYTGDLGPKTRIVTVTFGGNDAGLFTVLRDCLSDAVDPDTCWSAHLTPGSGDVINTILGSAFQNRLAAAYSNIHTAAPNAIIIALTYPDIFPATNNGNCQNSLGFLGGMNQHSLYLIHQTMEYLDDTIVRAARQAGILEVDERMQFSGHDICSSGVRYANGLIWNGAAAPESYHPTAAGYTQLANDLRNYINSL